MTLKSTRNDNWYDFHWRKLQGSQGYLDQLHSLASGYPIGCFKIRRFNSCRVAPCDVALTMSSQRQGMTKLTCCFAESAIRLHWVVLSGSFMKMSWSAGFNHILSAPFRSEITATSEATFNSCWRLRSRPVEDMQQGLVVYYHLKLASLQIHPQVIAVPCNSQRFPLKLGVAPFYIEECFTGIEDNFATLGQST